MRGYERFIEQPAECIHIFPRLKRRIPRSGRHAFWRQSAGGLTNGHVDSVECVLESGSAPNRGEILRNWQINVENGGIALSGVHHCHVQLLAKPIET